MTSTASSWLLFSTCPTFQPRVVSGALPQHHSRLCYQVRSGGEMIQPRLFILAALILTSTLVTTAKGQASGGPETVVVNNGSVTLHALLWRPQGPGRFPAILLNHGSGRTREELERLGPYEGQADILGPVFARHGYVFLFLFRRGVGLSTDQGTNAIDLMNGELRRAGRRRGTHCNSGCWKTGK